MSDFDQKNDVLDVSQSIFDPEKRANLVAQLEAAAVNQKLDISERDINYILDRIDNYTTQEAIDILRQAIEYHEEDPNFSWENLNKLRQLVEGPEAFGGSVKEYEFDLKLEASLINDWSPYPEVRAVTEAAADDEESCETFRVYFIGLIYGVGSCVLNTFFFNRFPSISITGLGLQLLIYPTGRLLEYLPDIGFSVRGDRYSLNPGPWTFKEQMLSTLMMSVSSGAPYMINVVTSQKEAVFYNETWVNFVYTILLTLCNQFMGFQIAGIMRVFLVYPVRNMWFGVLPYLALNRALTRPEPKENVHGWTISRFRFFWLFVLVAFIWYWFPNFVFQVLYYFNWMTWVSPNNFALAAITGGVTGLGLNPVGTFDWNAINSGNIIGMVSPFFATANSAVGMIISFVIIVAVYWSNNKWTAYLPINSNALFDNTGLPYNVSRVLTSNFLLNETAYQAYSPPYYNSGNLVLYGGFFAIYPAMIVYAILHYRKIIWKALKEFWFALSHPSQALTQFKDPFTRSVRKYPETPEWWFLAILLGSLAIGIGMVEGHKDVNTPVWTFLFAIGMNLVFIIPFGLLYAISGLSLDVNVLTELIMGYALPGNGNALMITKAVATNFLSQTDNYVTNQKQTLYARIPPRALFRVQMVAVLVTCFASVGIILWQMDSVDGYCTTGQQDKFTCLNSQTFFAASVIWGMIGPKKTFGGLYPVLKYCFLIGALLPIPFFLGEKYFPKYFRNINIILILVGFLGWAPYNFMYYIGTWYLAFAFNYFIRRRYTSWWQKYNYLLYSALSSGYTYGALILFFATGYKHLVNLNWWGNTVSFDGIDGIGAALKPIPDVGYFGPAPGSYP